MCLTIGVVNHVVDAVWPLKPKPWLMRKCAEIVGQELGDDPVSYYFLCPNRNFALPFLILVVLANRFSKNGSIK